MKKQLVNSALDIFSSFEKWDAFIDLIETKDAIQKVWVDIAKRKIKETFRSDDTWKLEYGNGNYWDMRWHLNSDSPIKMNFWLSLEGNFHFIISNENGRKAEIIKEVFGRPKFDSIRYVWGTDVMTNASFDIKLKQEGKWTFDSEYDGDMKYNHLTWFAGNQPDNFISQIKDKVQRFQANEIVDLLKVLQSDIEYAISEDKLLTPMS